MNAIILYIKGIIIGIGKIIPGVSGALLSIVLKVYDKAIEAVVYFFKNPKKNIVFLLNIGIGILTGIILFSNIINYALNHYYVIIMLFFIGLIIGGIPQIVKEVEKKDYKYTIIITIILIVISLVNKNTNYIIKNNISDYLIFFLGGIFEALGTVVPGLSSTALLLILGIYNLIIESISNINKLIINYNILVPFSIGLLSSIFFISKIMLCLLKKHKKKTYSIILGLILSSIIILIIKTFYVYVNIIQLVIGIIFMIIGIIISSFLG